MEDGRGSRTVCLDAIFFVLRTGCQWRTLDATGSCPGSTAHDRFQEWVQAGVFEVLWQAGLPFYNELKGIDWSFLSADDLDDQSPARGAFKGRYFVKVVRGRVV